MYQYDFQIADLRLRVSSEVALKQLFELHPFQREYDPKITADLHYFIRLITDWKITGKSVIEDDHSAVYDTGDEIHRYFYWNIHSKDRYVLTCHQKNHRNRYTIWLQSDDTDRILPQFRLAAFLAPEQALLEYNCLILHASVIRWQENGILFTGTSGIGKSTQAALWEQLEGAEILNGDRAVIRCMGDEFTVYGSPYAGTSSIYSDSSAAVRCVVVLSQATENKLQKLRPPEAFLALYQECAVHS